MKNPTFVARSFVVLTMMTTLLVTIPLTRADDELQNIYLETKTHTWELDVQCRKDLHPDTKVEVKTHPNDIHINGRVTVQQEKKRQACRVLQLAVVLR
jgi:hypothetical protein